MTFYHGSPIGGLNKLEPFLSEHGRHYIYFATNPLVALLYAVKPVPKPNRSALLNRYMQNPIAAGDFKRIFANMEKPQRNRKAEALLFRSVVFD